ncbi:MAG TPA: TIM barrel protein [Vicinamibacterales bacterium]|nr:TIM barrel protein [Vicinamibacterales bacterium]
MTLLNRRELLQAGIAAAAAVRVSAAASAPAQASRPSGAIPRPIRIDAYSRTLHWLRKPEDVADACHKIGNTTIDLTVRAYPGHVQPDRVKTDLPLWVKALTRNGITVTSIAADINDAKTPFVEDILATMQSLGLRHHWWRGMGGFDNTRPYAPQIETLKPRLAELVKLEEKYNTKAMYHPQGGPFFDYLELIRNFDPKYLSLHFDTGHWMQVSQSNMASMIMWAGPYIGGFVWKDEVVEKGEPAASAPAGEPQPAGQTAAGRGRGGGRGGGVNGFRTRQVPVGTGMVDFALAARALKNINFDGPTECQPEWTGLGGAESGRDTLTLPAETVIGLLKRDYETIRAALVAAGATWG